MPQIVRSWAGGASDVVLHGLAKPASRTSRGISAAVWLALTMTLAAVWLPTRAAAQHAALIVDANTGAVLHAEQADEPRYPASLTKMMTLYLAFEAIEQGRASYATRIKISQEAASVPPTKLDLDPGETISLLDAIKSLITKSANDMAVAIAEHLGGTEAQFARNMTHKARLFGMSRTTFRNASGLPDPSQTTTARDMVKLALRLQDDFPKHYQLFSIRSFSYDGSSYRNHNNLLFRFQGTDGIKTGYTRASGFNLVSSVKRGGRHVVGAIFGGRTAARRDDAMQLLLARALIQAAPYKSRTPAPVLVATAQPVQRPSMVIRQESVAAPRPTAATPPPAAPRAPEANAARIAEAPRPRPVMVPPRPRPTAPVTETLAAVPSPVRAIRPQLASLPGGPVETPSRGETPVRSEAPQRLAFAPSGFDLSAGQPLPSAPMATAPVAAATPLGVTRGLPPSTLQQQAASISRGFEPSAATTSLPAPRPMPAPYGVRGPMPSSSPPAALPFEIQIGAYATAAEAERALAAARHNAGDLLGSSDGRAVPAKKDSRQIYRARFTGFDSRVAAATCLELRRRQIDCFVMRAD